MELLFFTRFPEPGRVKTRLSPVLGPAGAAAWQRRVGAWTCAQARLAALDLGARLTVRGQGGDQGRMAEWLGRDLDGQPQGPGDLGQRMAWALGESLARGARGAVLFGADLPDLTAAVIVQAGQALAEADLVLAPTEDGGYGLIGLTRPRPELFQGIDWSGPAVLAQTLRRAQGLRVKLLPTLRDVDRPEDLARWRREWLGGPSSVSVIIPALDEARRIEACLASVRLGSPAEVIVVDGQSRDATAELARRAGARVVLRQPGRAGQQNLGAAWARSEILLFLHADTRLPPGWAELVRSTLARPRTSAGAFRLGLDGSPAGLRLIEALANFRSLALGRPYGDQAIFLRAETFWRAGGFPDQDLMEDYVLLTRLKKLGRIRLAPARALASARRWERLGPLRTTALNQLVILGHYLGLPPRTLARLYDRAKGLP